MTKTILSLCSGTGAWEKPYVEAGYNVISITLPEHDVRTYQPPDNVYGILAAPPCTHLCIAGNSFWKSKGRGKLLESMEIVIACLDIIYWSKPHFWCMENPIGRLPFFIGKPMMYFHPCDYGERYTKKTGLWGNFRPPMQQSLSLTKEEKSKNRQNHTEVNHILPEGYVLPPDMSRRQARRAITPSGFANAFFLSNR